jgi:uncharacterized protein GlcG (DUF336 family)
VIELSAALRLVADAHEQAAAMGARVSAAVVDAGGHLLAFGRMDGAEIAGPTLAVDKAFTALSQSTSTAELAVLAAPGGPLFGLHANGGGRYVIFPGGVPLHRDATIIGGVGVSGGTVEEDEACAQAAVDRWRR